MMTEHKETITFTVVEDGIRQVIETFTHEYRNLMVLLNDRIYLDYFGECGGQGRCATCLVKVEGNRNLLNRDVNGNEMNTLYKYGKTGGDSRLSCQIAINEWLNGSTIFLDDAED